MEAHGVFSDVRRAVQLYGAYDSPTVSQLSPCVGYIRAVRTGTTRNKCNGAYCQQAA